MGARTPPTRVIEDVVRLGTPQINWYLVADDDGVTVVDAGAPGYRPQLEPGLHALGREIGDVRAVILTHGDADHKGFAERLRSEERVPVLVHAADEKIAKGKGRDREASLLPYLRHPAAWQTIVAFARGGRAVHLEEVETFTGGTLDLPGQPRVIPAPGHSPGSVAFHFQRHGALITGDVLITWNVLTGRRGPQIMPSAFNTSSEQALESLSALEGVEAAILLPGHGDPWKDGPAAAVKAARAAGSS